MRCAIRYFTAPDGGPIAIVGWPFGWLEVTDSQLTVAAGRLVPFGRPRWSVPREGIARVEPTQRGVRFFTDGFRDPWVVGSLFPGRLRRQLAECGIVPEGPVKRTSWNGV
jgi:hypothetical protein